MLNSLQKIKNEDIRSQAIRSVQFINDIYPILDKSKINLLIRKIPHIGESHCLSFSHQEISISNELRIVQPVWIPNCYAYNFSKIEMNEYKAFFLNQYKNFQSF